VDVRDYTVGGSEAQLAESKGLVEAEWFTPTVDRETMRALMVRSNAVAARDTIIWLVLLVASGIWAFVAWGSLWAIPAFVVYGVMYGSASDARWHECGHRTAFKSRRVNDLVYHLAAFMDYREPISWRWSHARHHSDTIVVGRDPEIAFKRGAPFIHVVLELFALRTIVAETKKMVMNAFGRPTREQANFQPAEELRGSIWWSRAYLLAFAGVAAWCVFSRTVMPAMFIGLPTIYGRWLMVVYGITQHAGLAEDVLDHRLNTRTVYMNRLNRFMYLNMNYHLEHHIFPTIPYHALPALHAAVAAQLPAPHRGIVAALREIVPTLLRQRQDDNASIAVVLP
jgi:fatty acid desaturase